MFVGLASFISPALCTAGSDDLQIGMANSFFTGRPKVFVDIVRADFADVMKKTTGLAGHLDTTQGPDELGRQLKEGKLHFAILHGHEFASVRKKFPVLQPLLLIGNKLEERAYLIIHRNNNAHSAADLGGKKVALPVDARGHCRAFLEKLVADHGKDRGSSFGSVTNSGSQIDALNELAGGKTDAVIVDSIGLAFYKEIRGPVFERNLKVLLESEAFPAPVIVYHPRTLDEKVITRFREGLLKVPTTELGRQLMKDWNIDSYDPIPKDYEKKLDETLKAYPTR
jgi:ABC-type phosphate/phosphonate transport system substrate-binding protein